MAGHFGFKQGDFLAVGSAMKEGIDLLFEEARIELVEDGKAIHIFGFLADDAINSKHEIKTKDDKDEWVRATDKLVRIELVIDSIEKDYNGKKSKKDPTPTSAYIGTFIKDNLDPNKFYKLFVNLGAPTSYISAILTGKSAKGTELSEDMLQEFKDELLTFEEIAEAPNLAGAKAPEKKGGFAKKSQAVVISEKIEGLIKLLANEEASKPLDEIIAYCDTHPNRDTAIKIVCALLS